ncbi:MAG: copper resistance CopC/CopD family protein [Candidatus Limnocylindria bacterium]
MRGVGRLAVGLAIALGGALSLPQGVAAHALLIASEPGAGVTLSEPPTEVLLTFGEAPDPKLTTIRVLDSAGNDQAAGPVETVVGKPEQLRVQLKPLADGVFTVAWRTVSAVDGHVAAGSFAFGVGTPPPTGSSTGNVQGGSGSDGSIPAAIARWLFFLGLIALFGAGFLGFAIQPRPPRQVALMAGAGWVAFAVGTVAVIGVQWSDAQVGFATLVGSSVGSGAIQRIVVAALAGVVVGALLVPPAAPRWTFGLAAVAAGAAMLVDVLNGHAASGAAWLLQVAVQWLHIVAVGIWIGGLAALLLAVRGLPSADKAKAVRRFSTWAGLALALVAATGFLRALSEVKTFDALFGTGFGIVVIFKTLALGLLALLGATNRFFNVPVAGTTLRGLRRVGSVELVVGATVLAATGLLANLAPPSAAGNVQTPAARPVVAVGSDFGTSVRIRLLVQPGAPGFNQFTAAVADYDSGAPVAASSIALRFQLASRSGVGASTLDLSPSGSGRFTARSGNLSLDGIWTITATVAGPNGSVEVPLVVATQVAAEPVDVMATPGAPTIYTVHLPGQSTVQIYLDPGTPGQNEMHVTFFDAAGSELPVPTATIAMTQGDGVATILSPRELEPGHFAADLTAAAGQVALDVIGQVQGSNPMHAHLEFEVKP